ncbi:hypothetical protein D3C75_1113670 [compost metagenome]
MVVSIVVLAGVKVVVLVAAAAEAEPKVASVETVAVKAVLQLLVQAVNVTAAADLQKTVVKVVVAERQMREQVQAHQRVGLLVKAEADRKVSVVRVMQVQAQALRVVVVKVR